MHRNNKGFSLKTVNDALEFIVLVVLFLVFVFEKKAATQGYRIFYILFMIAALILLRLLHKVNDTRKLGMPDYLFTMIIIGGYMSIFGEFFFNLFYTIPFYDKILHLVIPAITTVIFYLVLKDQKILRAVAAVLASLGLSALWEIMEWSMDQLIMKSSYMQGVLINFEFRMNPFTDTMLDLVFGLVASVITAAVLYLFNKKENED